MNLKKTVDNGRLLRLEDESGAAITISLEEESGRILSLFVPADRRRTGLGSLLLKAAEKELFAREAKILEADYMDEQSDLTGFLQSSGFDISDSAEILSLSVDKLLQSRAVQKVIASEIIEEEFVPLSDLFMAQWEEALEELQRRNVPLGEADMNRFDQEISGVVYDKDYQPKSTVLCSKNEDNLIVEFLLGGDKGDAKYTLSALKGMLTKVEENGGTEKFSTLSMIAANTVINDILDKSLSEDTKPEQIGKVLYAAKRLKANEELLTITDYLLEEQDEAWREEISGIPLQANISYKMAFIRKRKEKKTKTQEELVRFNKNETETEGIQNDRIFRLTNENLSEFIEYLPPDVGQNMIRPFFHGLVAGEKREDPGSLLVWELKKAEEGVTESEIVYYKNRKTDFDKEIFREYEREIKEAVTLRSYFEAPKLEEDEKAVFIEERFSLEPKESRDLIVRIDELSNNAILKKKAAANVCSLKSLSKQQFKRAVANCLYHGRKGLVEDLTYLSREWFDPDVSACILLDNRADGMLLTHETASGRLFIDLLFSVGAEYQKDLLMLMRYSLKAAMEKFGSEKEVLIRRHSKAVYQLLGKLFPGRKGSQVVFGERKES